VLFQIIVCVTTISCADSGVQSPPASVPQAAAETQLSHPAEIQHTKPQQRVGAAPAAEKKSEPQLRVAYRPQNDLPNTESKPERKTGQKIELLAVEQNIVDCTNAERARFGLPAFVVDANLMATARQHCTWMTTYRQLVHANIGVAENIAMGQPNGQEVVRCWMNSSGHRANILNGGHRRIGVAAFRTPEGTIYWCQQFAP
jgi:uncharacterized protein YkwD